MKQYAKLRGEDMRLNSNDKSLLKFVKKEYAKLPKVAQEYLSTITLGYMESLLVEVEVCESPIEQLLGIALGKEFERIEFMSDGSTLIPQETIEVNDRKYRVDFFLMATRRHKTVSYVIECDGHEYHERTKEQAKRDRQRDRDMTSVGHKVLRFTGSEIYQNPRGCANEIVKIVIKDLMSGD